MPFHRRFLHRSLARARLRQALRVAAITCGIAYVFAPPLSSWADISDTWGGGNTWSGGPFRPSGGDGGGGYSGGGGGGGGGGYSREPTIGPNVSCGCASCSPDAGYSWVDSSDSDDMSVEWTPGKGSSEYPHVVAGDTPHNWHPADGYTWNNPGESDDLSVHWNPGQASSRFPHVIASAQEGYWHAAPGYTWVNDPPQPGQLDVRWDPGQTMEGHPHVVASATENEWLPESGYTWNATPPQPGDFEVHWNPGQTSRTASHVVASAREGYWHPEDGYEWASDPPPPGDMRVTWQSGAESTEHPHVIAADDEGEWHPAPGYAWDDSARDGGLGVHWVVGATSSEHPDEVASAVEGEWTPAAPPAAAGGVASLTPFPAGNAGAPAEGGPGAGAALPAASALQQLQNAQHQTTGQTFDNGSGPSDATPVASTGTPAVSAAPVYTPEQQQLIDRDPLVQQYRAQEAAAEKDLATHQEAVATLQLQMDQSSGAAKAQLAVDLANEKQAASNAQSTVNAAKVNATERAKKVIMGAPIIKTGTAQP